MKLNDLRPGEGARQKAKRVGRGPGSDLGKTAGRGHKGQKARSGGYTKVGFEGGQMPLQRRVPKRGFRAGPKRVAEVRLDHLNRFDGEVDLQALKQASVVPRDAQSAKVVATGTLEKAITLRGIAASAGATQAISSAGGRVEN